MGIMFLFYNQVEDYLFCVCQADATVPPLCTGGCSSTWLSQKHNRSCCALVTEYIPSYNCLAYTEPGTWVCLTNELMGWYRLSSLDLARSSAIYMLGYSPLVNAKAEDSRILDVSNPPMISKERFKYFKVTERNSAFFIFTIIHGVPLFPTLKIKDNNFF